MISVIIPVYNVEKYLDRCLESIVNQTYTDLEIILVDDGSPDKSPQICDEWAQKDPRIRVIHKKNEGQGIARNQGLRIATGKWVSFIDSDDFIDPLTYSTCTAQAEKYNADICYFGMNWISVDGTIHENKLDFPELILQEHSRESLLPLCFGRFPSDKFAIGSACMGIYKRSFIERHCIRFPTENKIISEDFIFTADICAASPAVTFINKCFYYYCANPASFTHRYQADRFEKSVYFHENRMREIMQLGLGSETELRANMRYWVMILASLKNDILTDSLTFPEKIHRIKMVIEHPYTKNSNNKYVRRHMNMKKRLLLFMIKMHSFLGVYALVKIKTKI